jgi:sugar phosphate isomerase/epimerase
MQLGISSYTYTWAAGVPGYPPKRPVTECDLVEKAVDAGVRVVQIADNLPLERLSDGDLAELASRAQVKGIELEVGTRGIGHGRLERFLDIAAVLKSRILRVVVDTPDSRPSGPEIVDSIRASVPELERRGICLAIENHDRFHAMDLAAIVRRIDSANVGICLDTVNSFGALEGPEVVVHALGPLVVNLHVKDFSIERAGHMMGFVIEGRPAGSGRLNVPWLLEKLRSLGRDPNAILELWTPPEADLDATIAKEAAWAASSIEYLRRFIPAI